MIRVVVDTNILVSLLYNRRGAEAGIIGLIRKDVLLPCISYTISLEYADVLHRPKHKFLLADVVELIALFEALGRLSLAATVAIQDVQSSPDPDDTKFIACAVADGARYLVTGNRRHFPDAAYGTAEVVSACQLLDQLAAPP